MRVSTALFGRARWRARRHRPACWVGLVLAVLLAQWLGQWHRVAHGGLGSAEAPAQQARVAAAWANGHGDASAQPSPHDAASHAGHAHAAPADGGLFGHHGEPECRLYDQLACADGLPMAAAPAWLSPVHHVGLPAVEAAAAWLSPRYQQPARAPPLA